MSENDVRSLGHEECLALLRQGGLGRLAVTAAEKIDIFPVNFAVDGNSILIRTAPGTKLVELTIHADVAFEIDGHDSGSGWSVIVHGKARQLQTRDEIEHAESVDIDSWMPTPKDRYVSVDIARLTGIRFRRVAAPTDEIPTVQEDAS